MVVFVALEHAESTKIEGSIARANTQRMRCMRFSVGEAKTAELVRRPQSHYAETWPRDTGQGARG